MSKESLATRQEAGLSKTDRYIRKLLLRSSILDDVNEVKFVPFIGEENQMQRAIDWILSDSTNTRWYYFGAQPASPDDVVAEFVSAFRNPNFIEYEILSGNNRPIGLMELDLDWNNLSASSSILIAREFQKNGWGYKSLLLTRTLARLVGFHTFTSLIHKDNGPSLKMMSRFNAPEVKSDAPNWRKFQLDLNVWHPDKDINLTIQDKDSLLY